VKANDRLLRFCYFLQTNSYWHHFIFFIAWIYMGLAIFEPAHSQQHYYHDDNPGHRTAVIIVEAVILVIYLFELSIDIYHTKSDPSRTFQEKFILDFKMVLKIFFNLFFTIDYIVNYSIPGIHFRPSRLFRPCKFVSQLK